MRSHRAIRGFGDPERDASLAHMPAAVPIPARQRQWRNVLNAACTRDRGGFYAYIRDFLEPMARYGVFIDVDDIHFGNGMGMSALCEACHRGDVLAVKLLLASGANPRLKDVHGQTPLHFACGVLRDGRAEHAVACVSALLAAAPVPADVNALTQGGCSPLAAVVMYLFHSEGVRAMFSPLPAFDAAFAVAELLIDAGADAGADAARRGESGSTPIDIARSIRAEAFAARLEAAVAARGRWGARRLFVSCFATGSVAGGHGGSKKRRDGR